jgi:hypothetical protein
MLPKGRRSVRKSGNFVLQARLAMKLLPNRCDLKFGAMQESQKMRQARGNGRRITGGARTAGLD